MLRVVWFFDLENMW